MNNTETLVVSIIAVIIILFGLLILFSTLNQPATQPTHNATNETPIQVNNTPPPETSPQTAPQNNSSTPPATQQPVSPLLAETEKVASAVEGGVNIFLAPTMQLGNLVSLAPFNVTIQAAPGWQTNFETPDSLKSYNPYDPNIGATTTHFSDSFYLQVFPSMPKGEEQQAYPQTKSVNGFPITYAVQNPNSPSASYQLSFPCYSDNALGVKYIVQSNFSSLNYYNFTDYQWETLTLDDFAKSMTSACSMIR